MLDFQLEICIAGGQEDIQTNAMLLEQKYNIEFQSFCRQA